MADDVRISRSVLIYGMNYAPEPTGVGRYSGELGAFLAREGLRVEIITAIPHYPGWFVREGFRNRYSVERAGGMRITRCPLLLNSKMQGVWRILAPLTFSISSLPIAVWRILTVKPDTVLCVEPTLFVAPVALLAAKLIRARTVLHVQDLEIDAAFAVGHLHSGLAKRIAIAFERTLLRSFDAVVTISDRMKERLEEKGIPPSRLKVVRNWVDLEKIRPMAGVSTFRLELGIPNNEFVALYAGNIGQKQALPIVLNAAEFLRDEPNLTFVIAGDGPEKNRLMKQFGHLPNVRFIPVQPEVRICDLLNLADVHLLPQASGTADLVLPSKLGGMLASGKPSIVMADPGTELYDFLGSAAILLPCEDASALAELIQRMSRGDQSAVPEDNADLLAHLDARKNLPAFSAILVGAG